MTEEEREMKVEHLKKTRKYTDYRLVDDDPVITELRAQAGTKLRIWLPNTLGTMDFRTDRCNAKVEKGDDGVFRITKVYFG